jgi:hypothetical protein
MSKQHEESPESWAALAVKLKEVVLLRIQDPRAQSLIDLTGGIGSELQSAIESGDAGKTSVLLPIVEDLCRKAAKILRLESRLEKRARQAREAPGPRWVRDRACARALNLDCGSFRVHMRRQSVSSAGAVGLRRAREASHAPRGHRRVARSTRGSPDDSAGEPEPEPPGRAGGKGGRIQARHRLSTPEWWPSGPTPAEQLARFVSPDPAADALAVWIMASTEGSRAVALAAEAGWSL